MSNISFLQCKHDSLVEVHSIRGSQVIFRVAKIQNARQVSSLPVSRQGSVKSLDGGCGLTTGGRGSPSYSRLRDSELERSLSANATRIVWRRNRCPILDQTMDILGKKWFPTNFGTYFNKVTATSFQLQKKYFSGYVQEIWPFWA